LTGHTADPAFLQRITFICVNHHQLIERLDTVRAFHLGNNYMVEVDIVLPHDMDLHKAHDIGESLQQKLESLDEVERAFVHLDYEYSHHPHSEHKLT
uniref:ZT_dimer domain-containing protein n=1 Tax=Rodentolepis nana TaxID=102285 RepID=A0A0R3TDC6_RODNA